MTSDDAAPERGSTEEERREWVLNAMGSFALSGMQPSDMALRQAREFISGEKTTAELLAELNAFYGVEPGE